MEDTLLFTSLQVSDPVWLNMDVATTAYNDCAADYRARTASTPRRIPCFEVMALW